VIDIPAIVKAIHSQHRDLVALQEIDVNTIRSGKEINEPAAIAEALGMYFYFGKAIDYGNGGYGVAILSRFPLSETRTQWLSQKADPKTERRAIATARVTLPGGQQICFASTHLDVENVATVYYRCNSLPKPSGESDPFYTGWRPER
jgi:endonuclease/exonuclease/phosphatase family metal-dependent hydrolase